VILRNAWCNNKDLYSLSLEFEFQFPSENGLLIVKCYFAIVILYLISSVQFASYLSGRWHHNANPAGVKFGSRYKRVNLALRIGVYVTPAIVIRM